MANSTLRFKLIDGEMKKFEPSKLQIVPNNVVKLSENSNSGFKGFMFQQLDKVSNGLSIVEGKVDRTLGSWGFKGTVSYGVFFTPFMQHIFPLMLDVAKVYCIIMICKDFYDERRGGKDSGSGGFGSIIKYGKWYLLFALTPYFVQLIGGIGENMYNELTNGGGEPTINNTPTPTIKP